MMRLQRGYRTLGTVAISALLLGLAGVPGASAETLGGEQLAASSRTVNLQPGAAPLPVVKAATWLIADAGSGEVLAHKGAHVQRPPASTLKMLTALTVLPRVPLETTYVATARAANTYGSRVGLRIGKKYTMDQLWNAVFLPSANDAAIAVAEVNGGVKRTVRQMNDLAYELRALDTVARNTSGLDAPGQLSSAYDLALIARDGLAREDFARYAATVRAEFPDVKGKGSHPIYTTNRMLLHGWKGAVGVKTGFTTQAGRTFVGAATRKGRTLIVSLMGVTEPTEDAAKKLLRWGFDNADLVDPVGMLVEKGSPLPAPTPSDPGTAGSDAHSAAAGPNEPGAEPAAFAGATAAAPLQQADLLPVGALALAGAVAAAAVAGVTIRRRSAVRPGRHRA
jgi:serine-type D-Ala-D-Ala carboxypeptidase (penicillin-binding protein 5/6)